MAMVPIIEIRGSIPVGIGVYDMAPFAVLLWSVAGNILVGAVVLWILEPLIRYGIYRIPPLGRLWERYILRIEKNHTEKFEKWGSLALILFVAIPLPMTGVVTGAVAAAIFQVPRLRALGLLAIGSAMAGIIITLVSVGIF